jgi:DNA polymerase II large subunit
VQEFLEENKERPLSPPGGGGKERTTQPPSVDELKELIKIGKQRALTTEEYARLNELQAELKKAMGPGVAV